QKHLALTGHIYHAMIHTISANSWRKLTPEQQAIFREESANSANLMRTRLGEEEQEQIKKIEAAGLQITRPDLAAFRAKMAPARTRTATHGGEANVKKFLEMAGQARG